MTQPRETEAEQRSMLMRAPKSTAKEEESKRNVRRMFKMLREVWLNIEVENIDTYEGVTVKVLLNSSATGMLMNQKMAAKHSFKLHKLERPIMVRNMNGTNNSAGAITYHVMFW